MQQIIFMSITIISISNMYISDRKIKKLLNYAPYRDLDELIGETIDYYRERV